jgi:hypothetical protein
MGGRRGAPWPRGSWAARHERARNGSEQRPLGATRWEMYANAGNVLDHPCAELDQALAYRCEFSVRQWVRLRDGGAHAMHQPERRGMEDEPHLIGGGEPAYTDRALRLSQQKNATMEDWLPPLKSTVSFLRQTDGRSKGSGVSSDMAAVAQG